MEIKYYKIILSDKFLGVATSLDLRKYFTKRNGMRFLESCFEDECQYIQYNDDLFHDNWMRKEDNRGEHTFASVIEITEEQYNFMNKNLDDVTDEEIDDWSKEQDENEPVQEIPSREDVITIEFVKEQKIKEMSIACQNVIFSGFDVVLSDGLSHHFSLNTQDQLNLITLSTAISDEQLIPYHADGELCKFYEPIDLKVVLEAATAHKTYHVSYFNSLRAYIDSLCNVDEIISVQYGMNIPFEHQSDVLKLLISQAGV